MNIVDIIFDALYPRKCVFCGRILEFSLSEREYDLCESCKACMESEYEGGEPIYAFKYSGNIRKCILDFKFNDCFIYGKTIARFIADSVEACEFDIITSVPSHKKQIFKRGYDHIGIICEYLEEYTGKPYKRLIEKTRHTKAQKDCTLEERKENVKGVFSCCENYDISGKIILLVDDVCTTGSTLRECAKVLKENKAREIIKAVMAKHN